ncbi:hypothetical protein [Burkholderia ubonensis]|uniref:hypothetical protein n=1 Tax=Burkholderia ubonensis TaxID=101571 RepID=UPI001177AA85|nr:hypothetical protein [Burkholderia ubonensis]
MDDYRPIQSAETDPARAFFRSSVLPFVLQMAAGKPRAANCSLLPGHRRIEYSSALKPAQIF